MGLQGFPPLRFEKRRRKEFRLSSRSSKRGVSLTAKLKGLEREEEQAPWIAFYSGSRNTQKTKKKISLSQPGRG